MKTISLITVYNNMPLLDDMLKTAEQQKNVEIDYIMIDNRNGRFSSAAAALNYGIKQSKGEVVVFLHQDVEFLEPDVLEKVYDFAVNNKYVIFGSAGVEDKDSNKSPKFFSSMAEGEERTRYKTAVKPEYVFTLDECFIACHRECLEVVSFDESVCDGWHLYGADLCLQAHISKELKVMVIPMDICHRSHGNADESYLKTQNKLGRKYHKYFKYINTTNGYVFTNKFLQIMQSIYRKFRY